MPSLITILLALLAANGLPTRQAEPVSFAKTVSFAGQEWKIKDSGARKVGPGGNWFAAGNVTVDNEGNLHLTASEREGACTAAEVVASRSFGYGTYRFTMISSTDDLSPNLVLGLFTWDDSPESFHREVDVELGKWNKPGNENMQFVVQPYQLHIARFQLPAHLRSSTHSFSWSRGRVAFRTEGTTWEGERLLVHEHVFTQGVPAPGEERTRINLWCVDAKAPKGDREVVLSDFKFDPLP